MVGGSKDSVGPRGTKRHRGLLDEQRDEFEDMLRALTTERERIKEAMGFAIDHSDASSEIVQVVTEALTLSVTPIPLKVARLFLVSDILHNCTAPVPNASSYRALFQATLPDIFTSMNETLRGVGGRMSAEALKEQVLRVLRVWEAWSLYPPPFLANLQDIFLKKEIKSDISENKEKIEETEKQETEEQYSANTGAWRVVNLNDDKKTEEIPDERKTKMEQNEGEEDIEDQRRDDEEEDIDGRPLTEEELSVLVAAGYIVVT
jgi:hypothetical protein